jgi:hypothetical protein
MIGTVTPNLFDRLARTFGRTTKAAPPPAALYPVSNQGAQGAFPLSWPGWDAYEKKYANDQSVDLARAKVAVTSPWVFSDITAIANEASVAVLQMKERDTSDEGETDIENHPLELVWETPNAFMGRSYLVSSGSGSVFSLAKPTSFGCRTRRATLPRFGPCQRG